jgi:FkbM family methyltransferase
MRLQRTWRSLTPARFRASLAFYRRFTPIVGFWTTARIAHPRLLRAPATFTFPIDGLSQSVTITPSRVDAAILHDVLIAREYDLPLDGPHAILDLGAHIGISACRFASRYPAATVIAVEPEPDNFDLLAVNATPYENIVPVHAAIWDKAGRISLVDPRGGSWAYQTTGTPGDIEAVTIEELLARYGIEHVDLLKVNIEGAEIELFSGNCGWLDRVDAIVVELHDRFRPGCTEAFERATAAFQVEERRSASVVARSRG